MLDYLKLLASQLCFLDQAILLMRLRILMYVFSTHI